MKKQLMIIGIIVILLTVGLSGCSENAGSYVTLNVDDPGNEFEMHYKITGDSGKPVLVLTAGMGAGMSSWTFLTEEFKDFRVITYDPRCMYKSGHTPDYELSDLASDLNELLIYLNIDKANILGWSLGGIVAQYFAYTHPEKVDHLILVSTTAMGTDPALIEINEQIKQNIADAGATMSDPPTADELEQLLPALTGLSFNNLFLRKMMVKVSGTKLITLQDPEFFDGLAQQWIATNNADTYSRLDEITAPTLLLHGTTDRLVPIAARNILEDALVNADVTVSDVPNGSHGCGIENAMKVGSLINNYLKGT